MRVAACEPPLPSLSCLSCWRPPSGAVLDSLDVAAPPTSPIALSTTPNRLSGDSIVSHTRTCATSPHFWHLVGAAWGAVRTCPVREPVRGSGSGAGRGRVDAGHVGWARLSVPVEVRRGRRRRPRLGHSAGPLLRAREFPWGHHKSCRGSHRLGSVFVWAAASSPVLSASQLLPHFILRRHQLSHVV